MIHQIIRQMRLMSGYSQSELAKKVGVSQNTISQYETKIFQPNYEMLVKIADACEFDILFRDKNSGEFLKVEKQNKE